MMPWFTNVPRRRIDSSDSVKAEQPVFSTVKFRPGCFFSFLVFPAAGIGPNSRTPESPSSTRLTCTRPSTVTVNVQVVDAPLASLAVQVTRLVPTGKIDPDGGAQETVAPGQLSNTLGAGYVTDG